MLALLDGRKSQTRRVLKPQPESEDLASELLEDYELRGWECVPDGDTFAVVRHLPYAPGDLLWVREKHWCVEIEGGGIGVPYLIYDEEWTSGPGARMPEPAAERPWLGPPYFDDPEQDIRWGARPSIHMPRWASRLTLRLTNVRVQRVQEISEEDARAEGLHPDSSGGGVNLYRLPKARKSDRQMSAVSAIGAFRGLWNSIHGDGAWQRNDWLAAISFEVIRENIDAVLAREDGPAEDRDTG